MKTMRILVLALAVVAAVSSGAAWANGEGERRGSNITPGSAATASTPEEVQAFFREMEQRMQLRGSASTERREPATQGAPQAPRTPGAETGADASRQGANMIGQAVSTGAAPIVPGGPGAERPGGGAGNPGATQPCVRCVGI